MSFGTDYPANPWLAWRGEANTEFPNVKVSPPYKGSVLAWAEIPTIVIVEPPQFLPSRVQQRRDVRALRRYVRRPETVPPQFNPPYPWAVTAPWRRVRAPVVRGHRPETVPPQFNPTFNFPNIKPRRDVRGLLQRGKRWERTPPQLNPPITFTVPQPRKVRGLFSRKSRPIETPLTQAAPAVNPDFSWGRPQPRTMRGLLRRKSKPVETVPAQVVYIQSDVPWSRTQARALRGMLSRRAGHPVMFIFPGAAPVKAGTGVYLERDAIRIIPLVTNDGGTTWRPRGT